MRFQSWAITFFDAAPPRRGNTLRPFRGATMTDQIQERRWFGRSLMLSAEQLGLTAQQVADVAACLRQ
jgi:hypothetical protein